MEILKVFHLPEDWEPAPRVIRKACRGIVLDESDLMPLLFVWQDNYHKLPWWGIEGDEEKAVAFKREIMEETWCEIEIIQEIGSVVEENSTWEQISYCYIWKVIKKWEKNLTPGERDKWYVLKRVTLQEALSLIENDVPATLGGKWRQQRDLYILQEIEKKIELTRLPAGRDVRT